MILQPWQKDQLIRPLFGTLREDGLRQYRECYIELPRKNTKSETVAALGVAVLFLDQEPAAENYIAATTREQTRHVFLAAKYMIQSNPSLASKCKIIDSQKRIIHEPSGSFLQGISADEGGRWGDHTHTIICDEFHAWRNEEYFNAMRSSQGARRQPLLLIITTAGYDRHSLCWKYHQKAELALQHPEDFLDFLPVIYGLKDKEDWKDESVWHRVNPMLGISVKLEFLRKEFREAIQNPAYENVFRRLYLNQWTEQETRAFSMDTWDACDYGPIDLNRLKYKTCYAGLDLGSVSDLSAFVLLFPPQAGIEKYIIVAYFWIPDEGMRVRVHRDQVPYDQWVAQGLIQTTPGNATDYTFIRKMISDLAGKYNLREVGYDRHDALQLASELQMSGMNMIQVLQSAGGMAGPVADFMKLLLGHEFSHGGNPVLRWMASNTVMRQDSYGNLRPDKEKSMEKIDGITALLNAVDRCMRVPSLGERRKLKVI